jgi:hypothetical protein
MTKAIIDKINQVWRDLYGAEAEYKTDDHALCARIQSLADDRDCWLGTAKALQKEVDKLKEL